MHSVRHGLIVALFTLLARPAFAAPGAATLVAPSGQVTIGTPITFSWQAVPESTWYLLWLGKGTPTAFVMQQWYSADQAGCASGGGTCTITIAAPVNAGSHVWFIQTWAAGLVGPWSTGMPFVVTAPHWSGKLPAASRFTLVLDNQAVLDNETGLVWQRTPLPDISPWTYGTDRCARALVDQRGGWRLPTIAELRSLVDPTETNPALPDGNPFQKIGFFRFWSKTESTANPGQYFAVQFSSGDVDTLPDDLDVLNHIWCVRGGSPDGH